MEGRQGRPSPSLLWSGDQSYSTRHCLSKKTSAQWILEGDIAGCFDNIAHDWLMENIVIV
ncbi:hypothetical protein FGU65_10700 [Methanoculleus sp. FWC-SCC1]|uniref:Reverse transcriptase domain-containing protein n=1 Tax=Methanoculleus frigidifontis TaxID=2584085 RepID=A0ABT8MBP9_9EURY|nr:hypothetical protein [Methanoculleus sp. FWC-SCC1]